MAITFLEKRKRLKSLIPVLVIVILITAVIVWRGFFVKEEPFLPEVIKPAKKIEIDLQALKSPELEELQLFEKTSPFEEEIGRENPFVPY